jgi:hypothetical protein
MCCGVQQMMEERETLSRRASDSEQKHAILKESNAFLQKEKDLLTNRMCVR